MISKLNPRFLFGALSILFFVMASSTYANDVKNDGPKVMVVDTLDLNKYKGLWYEIARLPNPFQDPEHVNVTAEYTLRDDGFITVQNTFFTKDGGTGGVTGLAKIIEPDEPAKLGVSFFDIFGFRPVWGDYWVLYVDANYSLAVVGDRKASYGWILSRTPKLSDEQLRIAQAILAQNSYDPKALLYTPQAQKLSKDVK